VKRYKVMLVDDHALVRMGFKMLLQPEQDIEVVAEADSGEAACRNLESAAPDVVVMDLTMDGMGGIEAIRRLLAKDSNLRILALSAHEDTSYPTRALQAGALGYLSKRCAPEALIEAIRAVGQRRGYLDPQVAQRIALQGINGVKSPMQALSVREFEVFIQLAQGRSVLSISETLNLSGATVGTHLYNIKRKLGLTNQAEITLMAVRHGLIEVGVPSKPDAAGQGRV
jgi:two-component system, NarL family, invasion response regulator UvrY